MKVDRRLELLDLIASNEPVRDVVSERLMGNIH